MRIELDAIKLAVAIATIVVLVGAAFLAGWKSSDDSENTESLASLIREWKKLSDRNTGVNESFENRLSQLERSYTKYVSSLERQLARCKVGSERFEVEMGQSWELAKNALYLGLNSVYPNRIIINYDNKERVLHVGEGISDAKVHGKPCTLTLLAIMERTASAAFKFVCREGEAGSGAGLNSTH
uniref:Uncharacterized protein n=1 Tax=Candidatus Kentrum eta TaxID=2126337 RepID=A0A450VF17_9GAMM|nr:MAG: hypothetical protein BECKH772B_GA0070898_102842 [Candidatus Kentron sp. H]VFK03321.1 MAG: hypothetical protein BECKH772A_GA0070896_103172 [Candidatus Kentron sp. H]VFK05898.1 MAG: hypothetical protein BECKH772C_GA0070978_103092 [Candidatus Kentron sp. H]